MPQTMKSCIFAGWQSIRRGPAGPTSKGCPHLDSIQGPWASSLKEIRTELKKPEGVVSKCKVWMSVCTVEIFRLPGDKGTTTGTEGRGQWAVCKLITVMVRKTCLSANPTIYASSS